MDKIMERFDRMLEQGPAQEDFAAYCRLLGVIPGDFDRYLKNKTGFSGEEIVDNWIKGICIGEYI